MSGHHQQQEYHPHHQHRQQQEEGEPVFAFASNNGFERSVGGLTQQDHQIRRDNKLSSLVAHEEDPPTEVPAGLHPAAYETTGMLSEMFNFGPGTAPQILDYRRREAGLGSEWYGPAGSRQVTRVNIGDHQQQHKPQHNDPSPPPPPQHHQILSINTDSAASMQLFLTNPQPRSPSPPPTAATSSTLHMLLPSPPNQLQPPPGGFHPMGVHSSAAPSNPNFWGAAQVNNPAAELGGIIEGQGLSLSLSSSLQQLEAAKQAEEFRNIGSGDHSHSLFFNQHHAGVGTSPSTGTSSPRHFIKDLAGPQHQLMLHNNLQGVGAFGAGPGPGPNSIIQAHQVHLGFGSPSTGSSLGVVNVLRSSKYAKPAQELLDEFCSVGRGQLKKAKLARQNSSKSNLNPNPSSSEGGGDGGSSSSKDPPPPLSPVDRIEHQRRKVKLLSMLDEVDRRYNHYCEQMQMVVNSFDMVMGYGAAVPYTTLAQKAMSLHFRCLKDAIQAQLKQSCEVLGEKDPTGSSGITKGETPRLKMLEQSLRQQRAFHQMGMLDQEAWRPQRGLPERSVNILRAWLFEHFLHPYPSDADKHLLARQTGLSRNQVSNWFINARVRLWKPMIEEMYQQESKEAAGEEDEEEEDRDRNQTSTSNTLDNTNLITTTAIQQQQQQQHEQQQAQNPMPSSSSSASGALNNAATASASASASDPTTDAKRSVGTMTRSAPRHGDTDPSILAINRHHRHCQHLQPPVPQPNATALMPAVSSHSHQAFIQANDDDLCQHFGDSVVPATMIRFGTTTATGDVSLTLGLRHAGNNAPDKTAAFSLTDFRSC